jgi:tetratricopeptide (TPR) repeat protein
MKSLPATLFILGVFICGPGFAQQAAQSPVDQGGASTEATAQEQTPALRSISEAKLQIKSDPKKAQAYNELALAYLRRARETADNTYLKDAEAALTQGLKLAPDDFQLKKAQVALLLSRHEFAEAREHATILHRQRPDDVMTYGYLAEADMALGDYPEAEKNAQWMMNLRPNNTPALLVGAKLRMSFGDTQGAIQFLGRAYSQTSPTELEEQAWILNEISSIQIESGQSDAAERTLERAEQLFPDYPYTTENLARVRSSQNRAGDAVQLLTQASSIDRDPHILYELAKAQDAAGRRENARATYAQFESLADGPGTATDRSKLDLILMYAEDPATAHRALKLAEQAIEARQDVWTLNAYAWTLYANANYCDADAAIQKAIAVGIRSAQIYDHAGHIAQKLNHDADAARYFKLSIQTNPASEYASDALKSAGLVSLATDGRQNDFQAAASLDPAAAAPSREPLIQPNPQTLMTTSVNIGMTRSTPAFAPVPEALLTPQPTATGRLIKSAQSIVSRNPEDAAGYAGLGAAYFQRARETGDVSDYQLAEESLKKSLDLVSTDFSADTAFGTMAEVCMGEHRFADALSYAQKALSLGTGDVSPFAIAGDAYADMGEYDRAADAYGRLSPQNMTLSPRAAYARDSRLAYLKFIAGDTAGAIGLMKTAVTEGVEAQLPSENLAWLYYELGEFETQAGDSASADAAYRAALNTHPGDYRALAALARLRANIGRYTEAIALYQRAIAVVPMPIFIAELGDLYTKTGNLAEARKQYALVEYIGLLGHINQVLHNRDLAIFYADHDLKLPEALRLAQKELEVRHDVYTWDALAWALYKNGKLEEAAEASEKAMRFGTRDPLLLFHAGMIAEGLGRREQALGELKEALNINPHFHLIYAGEAQLRLTALEAQSAAKKGSDDHGR